MIGMSSEGPPLIPPEDESQTAAVLQHSESRPRLPTPTGDASIYLFSFVLFPELQPHILCLPDIPTWMSDRHRKLSKSEKLTC